MKRPLFIIALMLLLSSISFAQSWSGTTNYATTTTYNLDGGITSLSRNSTSNFDNLTYNFNDGTHQLNHADDAKTASIYGYDLTDQATDNYKYDASGNLISNTQDALSITYNSFGKIEKITKASSETTTYTYDAAGNKIKKVNTSSSGATTTTYYFLDALGKEINIYESTSSSTEIKSLEASIDGYEQEGSIANNSTTASYTSSTNIYTRTLGKKCFYYKDHLGSIRTTYSDNTKTESDKKLVVATCENTFPYGMAKPLRTYNATNTRKGFQGKEAESALASNKTVLDFGARYNDTRLGLWMGVDALDAKYPSFSPYNSNGNNPIMYKDPDGREAKTFELGEYEFLYSDFNAYQIIANMIPPVGNGPRADEIKLAISNPYIAYIANYNMKKAKEVAKNSGLSDKVDGEQDAFRHAYASALMGRDLQNATEAALFPSNHELGLIGTTITQSNNDNSRGMDLYNNHVGIQIGLKNPNATDEELQSKVMDALSNGELLIYRLGVLAGSTESVPINEDGEQVHFNDADLIRSNQQIYECPESQEDMNQLSIDKFEEYPANQGGSKGNIQDRNWEQ